MRRLPLLVFVAALACTASVPPTNPYDPATPLELQARARVSGTVQFGVGSPAVGVSVSLKQNGRLLRTFTTVAEGAYVFDALTPGGYVVEAQSPGFTASPESFTLLAGADLPIEPMTLQPLGGDSNGFLTGTAVLGRMAAIPGGPIEKDPTADNGGILVETVGKPFAAVTTSLGDYQLTLPPGNYKLRISHPNYVAREVDNLQVSLGVPLPVIEVVLATNPAKVSGQVLAEQLDGSVAPLADALVTLDGTSATGLTSSAGTFTLDQLAAGSYLLRVLKDGYETASVPVLNLVGGETRTLTDPISLVLQRGAIHGTVVLADTPADSSGVVVELTGTGRAAVTSADGAYSFDGLVTGTYEVRARRDGYGQQVQGGLAVTAGATLDVPPITLARQGGTLVILDGPVTRLRPITLQLGAAAAASYRVSEDPAFADPALGDTTGSHPYAGPGSSVAFTLSDRDGVHAVYAVFIDASGGASAPASASIVLDRLAPVSPSVIIGTGSAYTRTATVGLSLSAQDLPATAGAAVSGLSRMELADNSAFTGAVLLDYNLASTWTVSAGDGLKAVYARFHDRAGNVSEAAVALVTLDTLPPQAPALALSGGAGALAGTTGSPVVDATLSATDANGGPGNRDLQVRLSNASGFAGAAWQPFAASVSWLLPPGDGAKTVFAQFMDPAGNQSLAVQASIVLAGTAPSAGSLTVAGGAAATNLQVVPVALSATGATEMRLFVNGLATGGWVPYATAATVDLGATPDEATRLVSVSFRNPAGVEGAAASTSIVFDQRAPTSPSLVVNGGAPFSGSATVTLALGASDAPAAAGGFAAGLDTVELADNAGFTGATVLPYATSVPWLLSGGDGTKSVWARFRDRAGNRSAAVSADVVLDTVSPASPAIALAGNAGALAGATGTPVVTATLSATDANEGAGKQNLQVRLSNDPGFAGATWQPYATTLAWSLQGTDGPKTVYAQFRDAAGNLSLVVNAGITLAATPPSAGSLVLAGGAAATNLTTITAAVAASGASQMRFLVDGVAATGWIAMAASAPVPLGAAPDEAIRTVAVAFRNAGGVEGGGASATIVLDQQPPTAPAVAVNGGAAWTGSTGVTLTLSASDGPVAGAVASGLATVEVANNAAFTGSSTYAFTGTLSWSLAAGSDGPRGVYARFRDRAGNLSAPASATILLDATGPTAPTIALGGNPEAQAGYTGSAVVTATLSATDVNEGAGKQNLQVRLSNDSGFAGATWQPYATSLPWVLPVGDGAKTVYAQFKDAVGNLSLVASATITLDATPPTGGAIAVAGGAASTNQVSVTATLAAVGAAQMQLYVNGVAQPGGWVSYAASTSVALGAAPDETTRTVSVVFRNFGGLEGGTAITSILMDRTAPVAPSILINADAPLVGDYPVTLALSASDGPVTGTAASGLDTVEVSNGPGFSPSSTFAYAGAVPWTLAAGADGTRTVYARFRDKAGNVSATVSDTITLDRTAPTAPSIGLLGNVEAQAGYTGTAVVTATLSATDVNEGPGKANLQVRLANDPGFSGANWQPYATSLPWVLPLGDGAKIVYAQFRDSSGNVSLAANATIQLLTAPPSGGTVALAGGAPATNLQTVLATIGASNAARMQLYVNGVAQPGGWIAYATSASVDLGLLPDESSRTVSVVFRSAGGVDGGDALTTIVMDRTAPVSPTLSINGGATYAGSTAVALAVSAQDGPQTGTVASGLASVEVAANAAFTGLVTYPYATSVPWTLASGDGAKAVYVRFRDKAGNASATASSTITLDTAGPSAPSISLAGNPEASAGYTGTAVVTATLSATDLNEGAGKANLQVRVANDVGFSGATWQPYTTALQWALTTGDGTKTVYAQFRDAAGNASTTTSAAIQLLTTPPTGGSILLAGGADSTSNQLVPVALSASSAATMRLSVNGAPVTGWIAYATSTTVDVGALPDSATRVVSVSFRNLGGVEGGAATASIRLDKTAPWPGSLVVSGTLGNGSTSAALTATPAVVLQITPPGADETLMAIAQAASTGVACSTAFATPAWQPISLASTLVLTGSDGPKRACVLFRDAAGNFSIANARGADITLDATPPTNPSFVNLVSRTQNMLSAPSSGLPALTASTDATSGGVTYQCTGGTGTNYGPTWVDCGTATTLPRVFLVAPNAQTTLGVRARDAAYNYSPGSFVQILHDNVAPFPPFITDIRSSRDSVTLTWDASGDTDVVDFLVYYGNSPGNLTGTGAAQGPSPISMGSVSGQLTQSYTLTGLTPGLPYYLAVEAVDAAGNRSGPGGERSAVPNKANPRVLSTFAGLPRTLAFRPVGATKTFLYFAENQGVVQFDATSDAASVPTGRAYLPDVVPDDGGSLPVFDCLRAGVTGHCVVVSGTTAEGDYRYNHAAYRAPAHVVYFPLTGTAANPAIGTIEAVLPVRPLRAQVATIGGEPIIFTFSQSGLEAYNFKSGKLAFLKRLISDDPGYLFTAVHALEVNGTTLWGFATSPDYATAPFLFSYDVSAVLSGLVAYGEYGNLYDNRGGLLGDMGAPFAVDLKGGVYGAYVDSFTDTSVVSRYPVGGVVPNASVALPSGAASDGIQPVAMAAGLAGHHYVFVSSGLSSAEFYEVLDSGTFTWLSTTTQQNDAVVAVAGANHLGQERVMVMEGVGSGRMGERFSVASATVTHLASGDFTEVQPASFVESDRFLYFANGPSIRIAEAANPLAPQLVRIHTPGWLSNYWKLVTHGRFLYALSTVNGLDMYRINGDGTLTWKTYVNVNASAAAAVGRWLFFSVGTTLYAYNTTNVGSSSVTYVTQLSVPGFTFTAMDARYRNSTVGLAQGGAGAPVPEAVIYATSATELRTFSFDGTTLTALGGPAAVPVFGANNLTVRGDYAVVGTPSSSYMAYASPTGPYVYASPIYPVGGAALMQYGYVVGLAPSGDPSGPNFAGFNAGAVDGTIRYSVCADGGLGGATSLTHVDGRYAASCGNNGVTLFTPVAMEGGRLLKSADVSATWNTGSVAPLAGDGMYNRFGGPTVPCSGCTDSSRLYSVSEQTTAEGTLSVPTWTTGNALGYYPPNQAYLADNLRFPAFMTQVDGALFVTTGRSFSAPTVDVYDLGRSPWAYIGRFTFSGTSQPVAVVTDGEYLYVARNSPGTVEVLDIRNPVAITLRATIAASGGLDLGALALSRDRLYAGTKGSSAVRVYDVSGLQATGTISAKTNVSLYYSGDTTGLAVVGGALFATQFVSGDPLGPYKLYTVALGATDRDGLGQLVLGYDASLTPLQSPVVAGDVLYLASNLGTASYDLTPFWETRTAPVLKGGANLADPFASTPVALRIDGPFAALVGGVYRVFDLR